MLSLVCVVVGEGRPFSVKIEENENVGILKNMIWGQKMYQFPADELELYHTLKGNTEVDEDVLRELKQQGSNDLTVKYVNDIAWMNPIKLLKRYLDANPPVEEQIHVLVVVPEGAVAARTSHAQAVEFQDAVLEASVNKAFKDRDEKRSVYSLSDMNSEKKRRILQKMGLTVNVLRMKEPRDVSIPGYPWIDEFPENQEDQRAQYMAYLEMHLMTLLDEDVFSLVDIANDKTVLDTVDPRLPFRIKGTADVLLAKSNVTNLIPMAGLCIVIELKKKVEKNHINQAIGQLMCASIKAPLGCFPMSLLTDLNGTWHFCYFSDKSVLTQVIF
ncbi:hypothetical protein As57867_004292, partial [Aphanomyces stellatus]